MSTSTWAELEGEIVELCPICEGVCADGFGDCVNCEGLGVVPHGCDPIQAYDPHAF